MLPARRTAAGARSVRRTQSRVAPRLVAARRQVGPEGRRVEAVDDGIAARVQVAEHEEGVVDVLGRDPQHVGLEPVPDPQQVVRRPAHHEGQHDDHGHLQRLHPGLGDDVGAAATQVGLTC